MTANRAARSAAALRSSLSAGTERSPAVVGRDISGTISHVACSPNKAAHPIIAIRNNLCVADIMHQIRHKDSPGLASDRGRSRRGAPESLGLTLFPSLFTVAASLALAVIGEFSIV